MSNGLPPGWYNLNVFVVDARTDQPIVGATVLLSGITASPAGFGNGTTRNTDGGGGANFGVLATTVDITILAAGYAPLTFPLTQVATDLTLTARLEPTTIPFPVAPSRDALCHVRVPFQGYTFASSQYGLIPMFGPEAGWLNDEDAAEYFAYVRAIGFTHVEFTVSGQYDEPSYRYPVPGCDYSQALGVLKDRVQMAVQAGLLVLMNCAGDGRSVNPNPQPGQYNDPNGWTYGYEWLMRHFAEIVEAMGGYDGTVDLNPYIVYSPGYDACVPGWDDPIYRYPSRVDEFLLHARSVINNTGAALALELAAGYAHWGGSKDNYTSPAGQCLDVVLIEYPIGPYPPANADQLWQVGARLLGPRYHRPPTQPASDDPDSPFPAGSGRDYLSEGCPRGAILPIMYEFDTYPWVRWWLTAQQVDDDRAYGAAMGHPIDTIC